MVENVGTTERSHADRIADYLQELDFRVARTQEEREAIYAFRYQAYLREGAISSNKQGLLSDAYDDMENCWIFGLFEDDSLVSTIRMHVISPQWRKGPALDVFPDIVGPMIDQGMTLIDPTRFATNAEASREFADLAYLTLRLPCMASEYFDADGCLATVRAEHTAFYRRVFRSQILCEPRPYPSLKAPIGLLNADVVGQRERMTRLHPVFLSSFTERRMLFERPNNGSGRSGTVPATADRLLS